MRARCIAWLAGFTALTAAAGAFEADDLDFIAEHLPEAAMDNRFLTLPLWYLPLLPGDSWSWQVQSDFSSVRAGRLSLEGAGLAFGTRRALGSGWSILGLGFLDDARLSGSRERRPLAPLFLESVPLALPAEAQFSNPRGNLRHLGVGVAAAYQRTDASYRVTFGVLHDRLELDSFGADFELLDGVSAGASGTMDYSAVYPFWVGFAAVAWRLPLGDWQFEPRFSAGVPLPRRGWRGRISGPGFVLSGDTDLVGQGVHMGDAFGGFGFGVSYLPWHLSVDLGASLSQALLEPQIHKGIDSAWLLSVSFSE
jgi:hypothetical protein